MLFAEVFLSNLEILLYHCVLFNTKLQINCIDGVQHYHKREAN